MCDVRRVPCPTRTRTPEAHHFMRLLLWCMFGVNITLAAFNVTACDSKAKFLISRVFFSALRHVLDGNFSKQSLIVPGLPKFRNIGNAGGRPKGHFPV